MKKKGKKKKKSKKRKKEIESFDNESERYADIFLKEPFVALQMWDTAGKERFVSESTGLTSRLGDSFFRHANVAILVCFTIYIRFIYCFRCINKMLSLSIHRFMMVQVVDHFCNS